MEESLDNDAGTSNMHKSVSKNMPAPEGVKYMRKLAIIAALLFVAIAGYVFLMPTESPAAPVITWTPGSVSETISPGATKTIMVSFVSSEDLQDVEVRVVPELEPYVSVEPSRLLAIQKGETVNCLLRMSLIGYRDQSIAEGVIQLRGVKHRTISNPLPVKISIVLAQYASTNLGVEVSYSPVQKVDNLYPSAEDREETGLESTLCFSTEPGSDIGSFCIGIYSNGRSYNLDEFIAQVIQPRPFEDTITSQIDVSGLQGKKFFSFKAHLIEVFVLNGSKIVHVYWPDLVGPGDPYIELFGHFLDTLVLSQM